MNLGGTLIPRPNNGTSWVKSYLGRHNVCGGSINVNAHSMTHHALVCDKCFWRMIVPAEIVTLFIKDEVFDKLREWLVSQITAKKAYEKHIANAIMQTMRIG